MYVFKFKERVFFWNILILAWICCLFPKFKSRIPLEIKNFDFPFLYSCLKSRKLEKYSCFLTAEILELLTILDSCLNQDLKVLDSWFLSRPLKIHLALLCLEDFLPAGCMIRHWQPLPLLLTWFHLLLLFL